MAEYLDEVKALYNTDKYTAVELITDKNTYTAKLPYTINHKEKVEDIYHYSINIMDWCRLRKIITKDYFQFRHQKIN